MEKNDLEMTRLCAEAMGWKVKGPATQWVSWKSHKCAVCASNDKGGDHIWDPLHDDAQAMALVKKFKLTIGFDIVSNQWTAISEHGQAYDGDSCSINRAIVECVAKMQAAKTSETTK